MTSYEIIGSFLPLPSELLHYILKFISLPDRLGFGATCFERKLVRNLKDHVVRQNNLPIPTYYCKYRSWNRCLQYICSYSIRGNFYIYRRSSSPLMAKIYVRESSIRVFFYHQWNAYSKRLQMFLQQTEVFDSIPLCPYSLSTYTFDGSQGDKEMRWKYFQHGADIFNETGIAYIDGVYDVNIACIGENAVLKEAIQVVDFLNDEWKRWKRWKHSSSKKQ